MGKTAAFHYALRRLRGNAPATAGWEECRDGVMPFSAADHTFVICAYGETKFLSDCARSLCEQTLPTRILIATSTPNDSIRRVAASYKLRLCINEGAPSIAHDWNCALGHCETPLVTIAHQDDVYAPQFAELVLDYVNRAEHPLLAFTDYGEIRMGSHSGSDGIVVDNTKMLAVKRAMLAPLKHRRAWRNRPLRRRMISLGSPICCPSVTYCLPNLPSPVFRSQMRGGLDWDAWERISRMQGDFVYIPRILIHHRIHLESETSALIQDNIRSQEDLEMFRRFWPKPVARALNGLYGLSLRSNSL